MNSNINWRSHDLSGSSFMYSWVCVCVCVCVCYRDSLVSVGEWLISVNCSIFSFSTHTHTHTHREPNDRPFVRSPEMLLDHPSIHPSIYPYIHTYIIGPLVLMLYIYSWDEHFLLRLVSSHLETTQCTLATTEPFRTQHNNTLSLWWWVLHEQPPENAKL